MAKEAAPLIRRTGLAGDGLCPNDTVLPTNPIGGLADPRETSDPVKPFGLHRSKPQRCREAGSAPGLAKAPGRDYRRSMTTVRPTIASLVRSGAIATEDLEAVAASWLEDRLDGPQPIGEHTVDVASAIANHPRARGVVDNARATEEAKVATIREAILASRAE